MVLGVARPSEAEERVVSRQEDGEKGWRVRPLAMFRESVIARGRNRRGERSAEV